MKAASCVTDIIQEKRKQCDLLVGSRESFNRDPG